MLRGGVARGQDGPREAAWLGSVMVSVTVVAVGVVAVEQQALDMHCKNVASYFGDPLCGREC